MNMQHQERAVVPEVNMSTLAQTMAGSLSQQQTLTRLAHALIKLCGEDGQRLTNDLSKHLKDAETSIQKLCHRAENGQSEILNSHLAQDTECELIKAVVTAQYFDRINQRLSHALSCLTLIDAADESQDNDGAQGQERRVRILLRAGLTLERERAVFDAIEQGATVEDALRMTNT